MIWLRKRSKGILSRKKKDSFVVIASTTSVVRDSTPDSLSFWTRPLRPATPALRATGKSRLSTRYCLSADNIRPDRSLSNLRK